MTIRSLQEGERDACLDLWALVFDDDPRSYFKRYFRDPGWRLRDTVVCENEGQLVSAVHVVRRTVETREGRKNLAGIANVATHPEWRGFGCATACLTELQNRIEADPWFDFALLATDIHDFYTRLGWEKREFYGWEGDGRRHPGMEFFVTDWLHSATLEDMPRIHQWYAQAHQNLPLAVVRDEAYWRDWIGTKNIQSFWQVSSGGYVRLHFDPEEKVLDVQERGGDPALNELLEGFAHVRLLYPCPRDEAERLLKDPRPYPISDWMVRSVQNKPLPDLTGGIFLEADGF
jgi:predicted N-acetyltransferase YhbS